MSFKRFISESLQDARKTVLELQQFIADERPYLELTKPRRINSPGDGDEGYEMSIVDIRWVEERDRDTKLVIRAFEDGQTALISYKQPGATRYLADTPDQIRKKLKILFKP